MIPQNVSSNGQHRKSIGLGDVSIVSQGNDEQYQTKELIWGCALTKETPEYEWNPDLKSNEDDDEDVDYVQETLSLKSMIAGKNAVKGQRNIVEVSTITFGNLKTVSTLLLGSVTVGLNDVCPIDLKFIHNVKATFRLVEGEGPVSLIGNHFVEFAVYPEQVSLSEGEDSSDSDEEDVREVEDENEDVAHEPIEDNDESDLRHKINAIKKRKADDGDEESDGDVSDAKKCKNDDESESEAVVEAGEADDSKAEAVDTEALCDKEDKKEELEDEKQDDVAMETSSPEKNSPKKSPRNTRANKAGK